MTEIVMDNMPDIPGLCFRSFNGSVDYPEMLRVVTASDKDDGDEEVSPLDEFTLYYNNLSNFDPEKDFLLVEMEGQLIGYSRVWWDKIQDGWINYGLFAAMIPEWRNKGIREVMLVWCEDRLKQIARTHDPAISKFYVSWIPPEAKEWEGLLSSSGYEPIRYSFLMVRPDLENIPDLPLPEGIEIRPVTPDHYRAIWEASREAFSDEWGEPEWQEEWYDRWLKSYYFQPKLWQIAWAGDEVAGMVRSYISKVENEELNRKWGYTENIGIRRPYRGKGLAKALIARSLQIVKDEGMEQAALGVDAENPSGALHLYKFMGFEEYQKWMTYRKPVELD
ncbi:MAG: GNAT family N-acetyltransferase [Thermoplasmata archaeon]|nr:GNAT family N-acetyltransferase [Thermoplasmata archaeon]